MNTKYSAGDSLARYYAQQDKLIGAQNDAIGRVVTRIEMYDEAMADNAADRSQCLQELLQRCRELKTAVDAFRAFWLQSLSPGASNG
jgi:hypothetical protein